MGDEETPIEWEIMEPKPIIHSREWEIINRLAEHIAGTSATVYTCYICNDVDVNISEQKHCECDHCGVYICNNCYCCPDETVTGPVTEGVRETITVCKSCYNSRATWHNKKKEKEEEPAAKRAKITEEE